MIGNPFNRFGGFELLFKDLPNGALSLLLTISNHIAEIEIQQGRILEGIQALESEEDTSLSASEAIYYTLLSDIHFYLIAWTNAGKALRKLSTIVNDSRLTWVFRRRRRWFENVRLARNGLEHIDERVISSDSWPSRLVTLSPSGNSVVVCGARVDVSKSSFRRADALTTDLARWVSKVPVKSGYRLINR